MEIGLFLNTQEPADSDPGLLVEECVEQTKLARDADFDLVMTGQHYLTNDLKLQPLPLLSRIAADAGNMAIGTGILLLPLHHPVEIAEQLTTLEYIADQAILGVGAGYRNAEFEGFGVPKDERGERLEESVEIINQLMTGENVTYHGEHYSIEDATINPRPPEKPPVWVGASAPRAVDRAARIGDLWFVGPEATVDTVRDRKKRYDRIRESEGKSTEVALFREAFVAPTTEQAVELARDALEYKYRNYLERGLEDTTIGDGELNPAFDALAEDRFIVGTPAEACAELERYEREFQASHVLLRMRWPGFDHDHTCASIELVGDEVIPNV